MARTKEARLLDSKRRFAAMYVSGPDRVKGRWKETSEMLGVDFEQTDEDLRRFIEEEGGIPPMLAGPTQAQALARLEQRRQEFVPPADADPLARVDAAAAVGEDDRIDWCKLAKELQDVAKGIAMGTIKTTAAQASTIKNIWERCYGKVAEKEGELKPAAGVLVLPMLGSNQGAMICPQCGFDAMKDK